MANFDAIFDAARHLEAHDRLRLIDALWDTVRPGADLSHHDEWAAELEKRVASLEAGAAPTVPWARIREEALARIGHGTVS
jgi:putative addiction module component (TIGR02574 family)